MLKRSHQQLTTSSAVACELIIMESGDEHKQQYNINKQLSPAQNTPALQATGAQTQSSATHYLVRSRLRVNYYGKRGRKKYSPLALCVPSHHSPLAPCARSHHPPLALLTCLQLSRFSLVSYFPPSRRKA